MGILRLLGIKPFEFSFNSVKPIEIVHSRISEATDSEFRNWSRNKSKFFYGKINGNDFDLIVYTSGRMNGKANVKIHLDIIENGTGIKIRMSLNHDYIYIFLIVIFFPSLLILIVFLSISEKTSEILGNTGLFIGFNLLAIMLVKGVYLFSIDLSKKALFKVLRPLIK